MMEQISSYIVGAALVALAGCFAAPYLKVAATRLRRQGLAFALIGAGFLASMASKNLTVIKASPVTGASTVSVTTNGTPVAASDDVYYTVETGAVVTVTWNADTSDYYFPGGVKRSSFATNVTASATADVTNEVALAESDLPGKYMKDFNIDQSAFTLTVGETTNLTYTITPTDAAVTSVTWWSTCEYEYATVDDTGAVTAIAVGSGGYVRVAARDKFGFLMSKGVQVTVVPAPVPTVQVKADAVPGATVLGAYTNEVKVAGDSPWTVVSNATVDVVYQAGSGYVFADGNTVFTNTVKATEAQTSATLKDEQKPIAVVNVKIPEPDTVWGLVYNGTEQIGITNIDARLTVGPGVTNGTDAVMTNCTFTLPDDNVFTNYQFAATPGKRTLTTWVYIFRRPITLKSASATKVWDGTELTTDKVEVVSGSYAPNEEFVYDVTGTQTAVGWSTNFYTVTENTMTSPKTKLTNYSITQDYGILTVTAVPTVQVTAEAVPGVQTISAYTNNVLIEAPQPWTVVSNVTVDVVYKTQNGYLFSNGSNLYTNTVQATEAQTSSTLTDEQKPLQCEARAYDVYYLTLKEALEKADRITLLKGVTVNEDLTVPFGKELETDGFVLTNETGVTFTVKGGMAFKNYVTNELVNSGAFVVDGGTICVDQQYLICPSKPDAAFIANYIGSVLTFSNKNCTVTGSIYAKGVGDHGHKFILGDADASIGAEQDKVPAASIDLAEDLKADYVVVYEQGCYVAKKTMPPVAYRAPVYKEVGGIVSPTNGIKEWVNLTTNLYTVVTGAWSTVTWNAGWYVVTNVVTLSQGAQCNGAVNLILADGAKLTANGGFYQAGIIVSEDANSLAIYGQSADSGELIATGNSGSAGIGGSKGEADGQNITINGGTVTAEGRAYSGHGGAGIGGGALKNGQNIVINGGTVTAKGEQSAAGIGGGDSGTGKNIVINGGKVKATAGQGCDNAIGDGAAD